MPAVEHETAIASRLDLLEAAQARMQHDLEKLTDRVDDHHAEATERFNQLRSDLQHAIGVSERRAKAFEKFQQEALEHLAFLTSKVSAHDTRLDQIDTRLDQIDTRLDRLETRVDQIDTKLDQVLERLPQH